MSAHHDHSHHPREGAAAVPPGYRRVLWIALAVNAAMFAVELLAGVRSGSVSLLADAIDFFWRQRQLRRVAGGVECRTGLVQPHSDAQSGLHG